MNSLTPAIRNLILINVIVFVAIQIFPPAFDASLPVWNYNSPHFQPFQLVTSMFTHFGFTHLLFNMLGLYFFGPLVEQTIGGKRTLILYLVGGIVSAAVFLIYYSFFSVKNFTLLGASGAVFAILILAAVYYPKQKIQLLFPPITLTLGLAAAIYVGANIFSFVTGSDSNVAHLAHLGGAAVGLTLGLLWKNGK